MSPPLNSQTKQVVYNVYKYFKARKQDLTSAEHRDDINVNKTVAKVTGLSEKSVERIVKLGRSMEGMGKEVKFTSPKKQKQTRRKRIEIDKSTEAVIRRKIIEYCTERKEVPTINKIRKVLEEDGVLKCGYEYMRLLLHKLGFSFRENAMKDMVEKTEKHADDECGNTTAKRDCDDDEYEVTNFVIIDVQETEDESDSND